MLAEAKKGDLQMTQICADGRPALAGDCIDRLKSILVSSSAPICVICGQKSASPRSPDCAAPAPRASLHAAAFVFP